MVFYVQDNSSRISMEEESFVPSDNYLDKVLETEAELEGVKR